MRVTSTRIPEVLIIEPEVFSDRRGFFLQAWHRREFADCGLAVDFVQDNHSHSVRGVLRGLHYQLRQPQGKLVRVVSGCVFDVAVDIRRGSPTFGQWVSAELSARNRLQLYVPPGFAHGFCVLSETADFLYKCTAYYSSRDEYAIRWDDPTIGIRWPQTGYTLSEKDTAAGLLETMTDVLPVYRGGL